jgi:hypothetical protein
VSPATAGSAFVLKRGDSTYNATLTSQKVAAAAVQNTR